MSLYHNSPSDYYKNVNRTYNTSLRDEVVISNKKDKYDNAIKLIKVINGEQL